MHTNTVCLINTMHQPTRCYQHANLYQYQYLTETHVRSAEQLKALTMLCISLAHDAVGSDGIVDDLAISRGLDTNGLSQTFRRRACPASTVTRAQLFVSILFIIKNLHTLHRQTHAHQPHYLFIIKNLHTLHRQTHTSPIISSSSRTFTLYTDTRIRASSSLHHHLPLPTVTQRCFPGEPQSVSRTFGSVSPPVLLRISVR